MAKNDKHREDTSFKTKQTKDDKAVNIRIITWGLVIFMVLYAVLRGMVLMLFPAPPENEVFFYIRQVSYIIVWLILASFFLVYTMHMEVEFMSPEEMEDMARKSLIAMIACFVKFTFVSIHIFPTILSHGMIKSCWNIMEILIWIPLMVFFFKYRKQCLQKKEKMEQMMYQ